MVALMLINIVVMTASAESRATVTVSGRKVAAGNTFNIAVRISNNEGISHLSLNLIYDDSVMTLTNVHRGQALASLNYITTNTATEDGYGIKPFKIMWEQLNNDNSNGTIVTLTFTIKEDAPNGNYAVSCSYDYGDVAYIDDMTIVTTDISIVSGNIIIVSESELLETNEDNKNILTIVLLSIGGVGLLVSLLFIVKRAIRMNKKS